MKWRDLYWVIPFVVGFLFFFTLLPPQYDQLTLEQRVESLEAILTEGGYWECIETQNITTNKSWCLLPTYVQPGVVICEGSPQYEQENITICVKARWVRNFKWKAYAHPSNQTFQEANESGTLIPL